MTYCAECGVYYTSEENICPNCGKKFSQDQKQREPLSAQNCEGLSEAKLDNISAENNTVGNGDLAEEKEDLSRGLMDSHDKEKDSDQTESEDSIGEVIYFQHESQLGKGIIKPQEVEMAVDGMHFKYETPSHRLMKEESAKERLKGHRVTAVEREPEIQEEFGSEVLLETQTLQPTTGEEMMESGELQAKLSEEKPEVQAEAVMRVELEEQTDASVCSVPDELKEPGTPMTDEGADDVEKTISEDLAAQPVIPEPELSEDNDNSISPDVGNEDLTIWEGVQSWFKVPTGNRYKVTCRSLMIFDKCHYQLLKVSLSWITEISVKQSWLAKLMNIGDLLIFVPEFVASKVVLGGISEPYKVKNILEERIKRC